MILCCRAVPENDRCAKIEKALTADHAGCVRTDSSCRGDLLPAKEQPYNKRWKMKTRIYKKTALICTGVLLGVLPGCVEVWVLNWATPFLLSQ